MFSLASAAAAVLIALVFLFGNAVRFRDPERRERWLLAAAILAGWGLSQFAEISYAQLALWSSLFAGMLMFFVLRHEVPSPKEGRFVPLCLGALSYAALALAIEAL
jgi:hypothetical protein